MANEPVRLPDTENYRIVIFKNKKHMVTHNHLKSIVVQPIMKYGFCRKNKSVVDFEDGFGDRYSFETDTKDNIEFAVQRKVKDGWCDVYFSDRNLEKVMKKM